MEGNDGKLTTIHALARLSARRAGRRLPHVRSLTLLLFVSGLASNALAAEIQNCSYGVGFPSVYVAGESVRLTMCRSGAPNGGPYLGTVSFATADPTIVLPPAYTYTVADNRQFNYSAGPYWVARHDFGPVVVFKSPGRRTFTFSFTTGAGVEGYSGTFEGDVVGSPTGIPALTLQSLVLTTTLIFALAWRRLLRPPSSSDFKRTGGDST